MRTTDRLLEAVDVDDFGTGGTSGTEGVGDDVDEDGHCHFLGCPVEAERHQKVEERPQPSEPGNKLSHHCCSCCASSQFPQTTMSKMSTAFYSGGRKRRQWG